MKACLENLLIFLRDGTPLSVALDLSGFSKLEHRDRLLDEEYAKKIRHARGVGICKTKKAIDEISVGEENKNATSRLKALQMKLESIEKDSTPVVHYKFNESDSKMTPTEIHAELMQKGLLGDESPEVIRSKMELVEYHALKIIPESLTQYNDSDMIYNSLDVPPQDPDPLNESK